MNSDLRTFIENANDGFAVISGEEPIFIFANPKAAEILDLKVEELIGRKISDFLHESIKDKIVENYKKRISGENLPRIYPSKAVSSKGRIFPIEINSNSGLWNGKSATFVVFRDITKIKLLEKKRFEQKELLRNILNNIPHAVFWKDKKFRFMGCNRNLADLMGFSNPDDIIGKTDYDLPVKKEEADFYRECDIKVFNSKKNMMNIEEKQHTYDGRELTILTSKVLLRNSESKIIGLLGIYADITKLKDDEKKLKLAYDKLDRIINSINDIIICVDNVGKITSWNRTAYIKTGITKKKALNMDILSISKNIPEIASFIQNSLATQKSQMLEIKIKDKNLNPLSIISTSSLLYDYNGDMEGVLYIGRDAGFQNLSSSNLIPKELYLSTDDSISMILNNMNLKSDFDKIIITREPLEKLKDYIQKKDIVFSLSDLDNQKSANILIKIIELISQEIKKKNYIILISHLHYLSFKNGFSEVMDMIYKINDNLRNSESICILHVLSDCFHKKELIYLKDESMPFPKMSSYLSIEEDLIEILKFIDEKMKVRVAVHYNHISKKFNITRKTTKKYLDKLQLEGLVTIIKEGRVKQIFNTALAQKYLMN